MRTFPFLLLALAFSAVASAAPGPIRILFLGHDSAAYLPLLMEKMGREAICFDYVTTPDYLNAATLISYDAVMLYANHGELKPEQFQALHDFIESGHGFLPILRVSFKIAAQKGQRYLDLLEAHEEIVGRNVTENLYERHPRPLFLGS